MNIKPKANAKPKPSAIAPAKDNQLSFKTGLVTTADAKVMLPPGIQKKLSDLGSKYGLKFDLANIALDGKMAANVQSMRSIVDKVTGDSKLLPEMLRLIRQLFKAEIQLAKFHKLVTKAAIQHQEKLDKETADIFLMMAGYQSKASKLEHRTNLRNQLKEQRTQAYNNYYSNSVYGQESQLIDAEFAMLESNRAILTQSKTKRLESNNQRKQKIQQYVNSAYN